MSPKIGSPSSTVQDELMKSLLSFALRFPSRSRSLRCSLDEIFARKMMENQKWELLKGYALFYHFTYSVEEQLQVGL